MEGPPTLGAVVADLLAGERVLGFDLETTGLAPQRDRIVQYALVGSHADGRPVQVERLVHPQRSIPMEASRVHGIHNEDVVGLGPFGEHAGEVHDLMHGAVIVGHNVTGFDWGFVEREFHRVGRLAPEPRAVLDTLRLARQLRLPRPHALEALCDTYGIDLQRAHTAAADAAASLLLLWRIMHEHPQRFRQPLEELVRWQDGSRASDCNQQEADLGPSLDDLEPLDDRGRLRVAGETFVLNFGKYRGRTLDRVWHEDARYCAWLLSPRSGFSAAVKQVLRDHLDALRE